MEIQAEHPRRPWLIWLFGAVGIAALSVPVIDHLRRDRNVGKPTKPTPLAVKTSSTSADDARQALAISDEGLVLEQGRTRIADSAANILADPRIAQLFLGGGLAPVPETSP